MRVLMISTDLGLLGERVATGDAVSRHMKYGRYVEELSIIVLSHSGYQAKTLAGNVFSHPTNSKSSLSFVHDAVRLSSQILQEKDYDLIVCQDPFLTGLVGCILRKKFGINLLIHFHGDFWNNKYWLEEKPARLILLLLSKYITPRADALRVVSEGIKRKLIVGGIKSDKIRVISTPVDIAKVKQPDNEAVLSIKNKYHGQKIIFWVGKMRSEKNLLWLLKSFKKIHAKFSDCILVMAGSGKDAPKINALRIKLNLESSVDMVGYTSYPSTINYFHAADIYILPSRHESFGKVLLEAGAAAKPSVASATTGAREIIEDGKTGFIVPVNNQKQFIARVTELLEDDKKRAQMGNAAYERINSKFDFNFSIAEVVNYWKDIVDQD